LLVSGVAKLRRLSAAWLRQRWSRLGVLVVRAPQVGVVEGLEVAGGGLDAESEEVRDAADVGWAALATALDVSLGQPDYSVDHTGWRPRTKPILGPAKPGVLGVLQAEHNLLVRVKSLPNAMNLRLIVDSQRLLTSQLIPYEHSDDAEQGIMRLGRLLRRRGQRDRSSP
jgi:hypothetical protein